MRLYSSPQPGMEEEGVSADPDDDIFLSCALFVGAAYLVSGDRHLLDLGVWCGLPPSYGESRW